MKKVSVSRRGFITGAVGAGCMLALGGVVMLPEQALCRPPGTRSENAFVGACVRCGKCIEVCPNACIVPATIEDGVVNLRTPKLGFSRSASQLRGAMGWCDHCTEYNNGVAKCAEVCPSGALTTTDDSSFDTMQLGVARIETDWCLAWMMKGCTLCKNACPQEAITFDEHNRPHVDESLCNGCGSCEQACVSLESVSVSAGGRSATTRAINVVPVGA
ncbi:4Fe-4S dicluster domain-containing protein [Adlercreutzia equolifaciens]|uniref:4Fe-4S dicluster domain-containing protein n=1 Tax=Adlercreutzia equolifaciens TaxID=446660 RepID=UPI0023B1B646|nr:4Fe-4S dicluster domain-containing protein [Adlercreutzia equolifaciens]MDE8701726.1 4Fe-4S dicluster domain-containing protein [Adlercreutzia equolifaciens]